MGNTIYSISQTNQPTIQTVHSEIMLALGLISALNLRLAGITEEKLKDLLIQYILANMTGNTAEKTAILGEIGKVLKTFQKDLEQTKDIETKLTSMERSPNVHDQTYLQNLIKELKEDISSGSMSNLFSSCPS